MGTLVGDGTYDGVGDDPGGGGGAPATSAVWTTRRITTGGVHAVAADDIVLVIVSPDGVATIQLPAVGAVPGRQLWIKRLTSAFGVVITSVDASLEDGDIQLDVDRACLHLGSDGVVWMIVS